MTTGRILLIAAIVAIGYYWYSNNQAELQRPALQHQTDLQTQARWEREAAEERAKLEREQAKQGGRAGGRRTANVSDLQFALS